jgi:hypothetical protein
MGETANEIETHIERTRQDLGSNLNELENKVKSVTDWKHHFQNSPMTMIGVALGGGILLATALGGRKGRRLERSLASYAGNNEPHAGLDRQKNKAREAWDNIKGALIGVAAARVKDFVGEVVPGFQEQFDRTQRENPKSLPNPNPAS